MRSIKLPSWTERLLGLEPQPAPPHVFAIDARHLRYGGFTRTATGLSFDSYQIVELPAGVFADGPLGGPVRDVTAFSQIVREFVEPIGPAARAAGLVLPDAWLRMLFTEIEELPVKTAQRDEIVRWKLKRLVPFRVDDLRVASDEVSPLAAQEEPCRILLGFAIELLLEQLEGAFSDAGVQLGQVTNATMAALSGIDSRANPDHLISLVMVEDHAYSIAFIHRNEPFLYRHKSLLDMPKSAHAQVVRRDLRLTRNFLREHLPSTPLQGVVLAVAPSQEGTPWASWLEAELAATTEWMGASHLPLAVVRADLSWQETAVMVGCAAAEVV